MKKMGSAKSLTDAEINYIAEQSGVDIDVVKAWYKEFLQTCPKGKMDKKQFAKYYKMLRCQSDEKLSKITDHVFACFDKDGNGSLDFSEFLIAYSGTSMGDPRRKLEFVFAFYDKDHDGVIKQPEFLQVIQAMYEFRCKSKKDYSPEKCVKDIFERIDENGDNRITKNEFIEGCLKHKHILDLVSPFEI